MPYFLSQLSCGHFNFRTPDADAIRWQLSTAAVCGANAVQWFHIYQHAFHEDYYVYPVDKFGNKSEIYGCIVRETATFREKVLKPLTVLNTKPPILLPRLTAAIRSFRVRAVANGLCMPIMA